MKLRTVFASTFAFLISLAFAPFALASDSHTTNVNGVTRHYLLHVPPNMSRTAAPLVIALHGGGGNGRSMERYSRFDEVVDREKFLVAYPDGLDRGWNDGRGEIRHSADDVAFIAAVIDDVARVANVDAKRVYATGISNGGMMSNRIACELSERIAAVSLVASSGGTDAMQACPPSKLLDISSSWAPGTLSSLTPAVLFAFMVDARAVKSLAPRRQSVSGLGRTIALLSRVHVHCLTETTTAQR